MSRFANALFKPSVAGCSPTGIFVLFGAGACGGFGAFGLASEAEAPPSSSVDRVALCAWAFASAATPLALCSSSVKRGFLARLLRGSGLIIRLIALPMSLG